jgi:hypothetical protein
MHAPWFPVAALAAALCAGCATTSVKTDYDRKADFNRYRTYAIKPGRLAEDNLTGTPDTMVHSRIQDQLKQQLSAIGLQPAANPANPDVIVTYGAGVETRRELVENLGGGGPNWNYGGNDIFARDVQQGTLVIDVIDARSQRMVWRAVTKGQNKNFRSEKFIRKAVDMALAKYPAPEAS